MRRGAGGHAARNTTRRVASYGFAVTVIARWAALWLRAQLGDPVGRAWVYGLGDAVDTLVQTQYDRGANP